MVKKTLKRKTGIEHKAKFNQIAAPLHQDNHKPFHCPSHNVNAVLFLPGPESGHNPKEKSA